jgi:hypothetical protein
MEGVVEMMRHPKRMRHMKIIKRDMLEYNVLDTYSYQTCIL